MHHWLHFVDFKYFVPDGLYYISDMLYPFPIRYVWMKSFCLSTQHCTYHLHWVKQPSVPNSYFYGRRKIYLIIKKSQNIINMTAGHSHGRNPLQQLKSRKYQALDSFHSPIRSELFRNIYFETSATAVMILLRDSIFLILPISLVFPLGAFLGYLQPIFLLCPFPQQRQSFFSNFEHFCNFNSESSLNLWYALFPL